MAEEDAPHGQLADALRSHLRSSTPLIRTVLRPRPLETVSGERVAFFGTAPATHHARLASHLEGAHGASVSLVSGNLADRGRLREDLAAAAFRQLGQDDAQFAVFQPGPRPGRVNGSVDPYCARKPAEIALH